MLQRAGPSISAIITTFNEGAELHRTLESLITNTRCLREVIVVDDGSTDDSCHGIDSNLVRVIRHGERIGVAYCRDEASRQASGDVLCYLDAHHRFSPECLDRCATVAAREQAICCPDVQSYRRIGWRMYGASFRLCPTNRYFSAEWRTWRWRRGIERVTALKAPPYLLPRRLYPRLAWSPTLRGWGASESSIVVKAFFTNTPILNVGGPVAKHWFRKEFHYETGWNGVWRNHAIIARTCFGDEAWRHYWRPNIFESHLSDNVCIELESDNIAGEQMQFCQAKVKEDRSFWTELLRTTPAL